MSTTGGPVWCQIQRNAIRDSPKRNPQRKTTNALFTDPDASDSDSDDGGSTVVAPAKQEAPTKEKYRIPKYNVLLWDSDDHTFEYVEKMLRELFGHTHEQCVKIAETVDNDGKAVVLTTTKEHAELKRDQIHAYGKDHSEATKGSMWATIESTD